MKRIVFNLLLVVGLFSLYGCEKETTSSNSDPNVFCNEAGCAVSDANKQKCIDFYNSCMAANPDANDDECVAGALAICK